MSKYWNMSSWPPLVSHCAVLGNLWYEVGGRALEQAGVILQHCVARGLDWG